MNEESKRARHQARTRSRLQLVEAFEQQPRVARIPGSVLDLVSGKSPATRWRWIAKGLLPKPGADGCFNVGEVRDALERLAVR